MVYGQKMFEEMGENMNWSYTEAVEYIPGLIPYLNFLFFEKVIFLIC